MFESLAQAEELLAYLMTLARQPNEINRIRQVEYDFKRAKLEALIEEGKLEWLDGDEYFARYHLEREVRKGNMFRISSVEVRRATLGDWKSLRRVSPEEQIIALVRGTDELGGGTVRGENFADLICGEDLDDLMEVVLFPFARRPGGAPTFGSSSSGSSDAPPSNDP